MLLMVTEYNMVCPKSVALVPKIGETAEGGEFFLKKYMLKIYEICCRILKLSIKLDKSHVEEASSI